MAVTRKEKICVECGRVFYAKTRNARRCESCAKYKYKRPAQKQQKSKPSLPIVLVSRIERIYNKVHGTYKHYGEIVNIIEGTPPDRCVSCGEIVPEGRLVCPICEKKGNRWFDA